MTGRLIAIGDIHGCDVALESLLGAIEPRADDTIVTLGDYVDRGRNSRRVLEQLIELQGKCRLVPLLGNHDEMMLDTFVHNKSPTDWIRFGASDTLDSYGFQGDPAAVPREHLDFLRGCVDYFEGEQHFFVHANYRPDSPLSRQPIYDLRWLKLRESQPGPHLSGKIAIVGHSANKSGDIVRLPHLICIDTYCYGGGWLTALDTDSYSYWQADLSGTIQRGQLAR